MNICEKNIQYTNIPIAISLLHVKEYANILKRKDRIVRRTSSESNSLRNIPSTTNNISINTVRQNH